MLLSLLAKLEFKSTEEAAEFDNSSQILQMLQNF